MIVTYVADTASIICNMLTIRENITCASDSLHGQTKLVVLETRLCYMEIFENIF